MNTNTSYDQFKQIRIGENLVADEGAVKVNYRTLKSRANNLNVFN